MKTQLSASVCFRLKTWGTLSLVLALANAVQAGTTTWSGAGGNQNWSTPGNWTTAGGSTPPGTGDTALFRVTGASGTGGTINNIVDTSRTIAALTFSNETSATFHTTQIPAGNTLTVAGPIFVGGTNNSTSYTMTGGGTLTGGTGTSALSVANSGTGTVTFDLSSLTNFIFNAGGAGGTFSLGLDAGQNSGGALKLAFTSNNITATTMAVGQNNNGGTAVTLSLGAGTNILNVNTLEVGWDKLGGTVQFYANTGGLHLRNAAETGGAVVDMGDQVHSGGATASATSSIMLKGHYVDMLVSTLTLANRHQRTGGTTSSFFSFDTGVVNVTNVIIATNQQSGTTIASSPIGALAVGGGVMNVVNNILLANIGGTNGSGSLVITNGGLVTCGGSIFATSTAGTNNLTLSGGTLTLTSAGGVLGLPSFPLSNLNLTNATLHLVADFNASTAKIVANAINTNGANLIVIDSLVNASGSATIPLISYTGTDPFGSLSLHLPTGYTGNLVDAGGGLIQLSITAPVSAALAWAGITNSVLTSTWDTNKTKAWVDQATRTISQVYADPDAVLFDDNGQNSTVTLAGPVLPLSVAFNNSSLSYLVNGPGKISGPTGLITGNNGTVLLQDNGDNFSGDVVVNGGDLILDETNSAISGGLSIAGGAIAQIGLNDTNGALPAGAVDTEGMLIFSRANNLTVSTAITGGGSLTQNGNGVLTLSGANGYTGTTTISRGSLALSGAGSVSSSSGLLVSNATFNVSALTAPVSLADFSLTNSVIEIAQLSSTPALSANSIEVDGAVVNSNILDMVSLPAIATYPVTIPVIKSAGPITFENGANFNLLLGSLPAASPAYAGSLSLSGDGTTILLTLTTGPVGQRSSVTWADVADANANANWSTSTNWTLPGAPISTDNVLFDSTTTVGAPTTINNTVDTSFTVADLSYIHTNSQYQVTQIPAGNVLTVNNNFTVGNLIEDGAVTHVAFTDAGTLVVDGSTSGNLVGNSSATGIGGTASLDLSGLSNFVFNASGSTFGVGNLGSRGQGTLLLAGVSNNITASTVALETSSASSSVTTSVTLGSGTNSINAATFNLGATRASCTLQFPAGITTAGLRMRGVSGADTDRMTLTAGNRSSGGSSGTANGLLHLNGNRVDLKLSTLTLGKCNQVSPVTGNGVLQFDTGVVDVNAVVMAVNTTTGTANGTSTVGANATLIVGSGGISLVNNLTNGTAGGTLTISGGTVICSNSIVKATSGGTGTISLTDGTLNMVSGVIGSLPLPIDNLNLSDSGALDTKIGLSLVPGLTNIVAANIVASGVTTLNINSISGVIGTVQIPLVAYTGGADPYPNLALGSVPAGYTGAMLVDNPGNGSVDLLITSPTPLAWVGAVGSTLNSTWSNGGPLNWLNGATAVSYTDGDFVLFSDASSNSIVTLPATVSPGGMIVSNNIRNYTINGPGGISGGTGINLQGTGTLVLDNAGTNNFIGGVQIGGGTLQVGNNDTNGTLPAGLIADNGTLAFDRSDSLAFSNIVYGLGGISQVNTNLVSLAATNSYAGGTFITTGTLRVNNTNSLGSWSGGAVTVTNGGTLDLGGLSTAVAEGNPMFGAKQFIIAGTGVGGLGAIVNNGPNAQLSAFQSITLTANSTIGGQNRWDIRNGTPTLNLNGFTLTKISTNQDSFVSTAVSATGNIIINQGILSFETSSAVNGTGTITVNSGGSLGHYRLASGGLTMPITLNGGAITNLATTLAGSIDDAPITLTANSILGGSTGTNTMTLNGVISSTGSYGLTKAGAGTFILTADSTYTGNTVISTGSLALSGSISDSAIININTNASLDVSLRPDTTLTLNSGQTLGGFGAVTGIVNSLVGSTVSPGSATATGILTATGNATLAGTTIVKLNAAANTNDVLSSGGVINYGGVLQVSNLGGTLTGTSAFKLFNAAPGNYAGFFSSISPAVPAPGLAWNTNTLTTDGTLRFTVTVNLNPTNILTTVNGSTLTLTWPQDHTGWTLQAQTNSLANGLGSNWVNVSGSTTVNSMSFQMDPTQGTVFYRLTH